MLGRSAVGQRSDQRPELAVVVAVPSGVPLAKPPAYRVTVTRGDPPAVESAAPASVGCGSDVVPPAGGWSIVIREEPFLTANVFAALKPASGGLARSSCSARAVYVPSGSDELAATR